MAFMAENLREKQGQMACSDSPNSDIFRRFCLYVWKVCPTVFEGNPCNTQNDVRTSNHHDGSTKQLTLASDAWSIARYWRSCPQSLSKILCCICVEILLRLNSKFKGPVCWKKNCWCHICGSSIRNGRIHTLLSWVADRQTSLIEASRDFLTVDQEFDIWDFFGHQKTPVIRPLASIKLYSQKSSLANSDREGYQAIAWNLHLGIHRNKIWLALITHNIQKYNATII